jgi:hypothetical protein
MRILTIVFLFSYQVGISQFERSLPTVDAAWFGTQSGGVWADPTYPYVVFYGETIINGLQFVNCYKSASNGNLIFNGNVRIDHPNSKLYYLPSGSTLIQEMTFPSNLQSGNNLVFDPIFESIFPFNPSQYEFSVMNVDSVLLTDGYHKRYNLYSSFPLGSAKYIDGVGLVELYILSETGNSFIDCFSIENIEILSPTELGCSMSNFNVGMEETLLFPIEISHSNNYLYFKTNEYQTSSFNIQVISLEGKIIINNSQLLSEPLDVSKCVSGIYIVQISNGESHITRKISID